jgi:diguanylate cyclase (GGDEF)-like protein
MDPKGSREASTVPESAAQSAWTSAPAAVPVRNDREAQSFLDYLFFKTSKDVSQERAQAVARLMIIGALLGGTATAGALQGFPEILRPLLLFGVGYGLFGIGLYIYLRRLTRPAPLVRVVGMLGDLSAAGALSYLAGVDGLAFYPLFLWIIIGNGLRFGHGSLTLATLIGLVSFISAHLLSGVAFEYPGIFAGLIIGLLMLPRFMHLTLARLATANRELQEQKEQAQFLAQHDVLTGLPNRQLLLLRLEHAINRARRNRTRLAVLFLDLDGFKRINDSLGHDYGDQLLILVADCLRRTVRRVDTLSRLGGDEFILLIEEYRQPRDISAVVERMFGCARRLYNVKGTDAYLTWSCGIALYPKDGKDGHTLIKNADIAMYRAKARGGNRAVSYDPAMSRRIIADLKLRTELRRAIDSREFYVVYQPLRDALDGSPVGLEALVRWEHPHQGAMAPEAFLDVAMESGLMRQVDRLVLDIAIGDMVGLRRQSPLDLRLAINVSPHHLDDDGFSKLLEELLKKHGLPPTVLDLEITERALIRETETSRAVLRLLRDQGIRVTLDDFGTGCSSLAHLRHCDVDNVKLDRGLVQGIPDQPGDCATAKGILGIARSLDLAVAAVGVETDEQRLWLAEHGCTLVQGYGFGRPAAIDEIDPMTLETRLRTPGPAPDGAPN